MALATKRPQKVLDEDLGDGLMVGRGACRGMIGDCLGAAVYPPVSDGSV